MKLQPETIQKLDPKKVLISKLNTRQPKPTDPSIIELMAAIKASGQISPAVARPHAKLGHYEIAAGARRKVACQALGITLDTVVRDIPDDEFEDMILTDNLQREDPDPMQEALLIERRMAAGASPSETAARYGKSETWLKRRMKLLGLTEASREATQPGEPFQHYTTEMLEFVGSLPPVAQEKLLNNHWRAQQASTLRELTDIFHETACDLEKTEWLNDPATFVEGCGPGCAHNSAETLFPDKDAPCGSCVNTTCFRKRAALAQDAAIATVLAGQDIGGLTLFSSNYSNSFTYQGNELKMLNKWQREERFKVLKKPREGAKPALDLTDPFAPKVCYLMPKDDKAPADSNSGSPAKESREDRLTAKRLVALNGEIDNDLADAPPPAGVSMLKLAAAFGMNRSHTYTTYDCRVWKSLDADGEVPIDSYSELTASPEEAVWLAIRPILRQRLKFSKNSELLKEEKRVEMQRVATLIGTDYEAKWLKVCADIPVPKSWGPGFDNITLEPLHKGAELKAPATETPPEPVKTKPAKPAAKKAATKKTATKKTTKKTKAA